MKARIKFRKYGPLRFIGHLDVMRFFQKLMRRSDIPIAFTGGYSPHMIMSFASPLGIGLSSDGEYLDIELAGHISSQQAVERLNQVMVEGMEVLSVREVPEGKKGKAMSLVSAADYLVSFRKGMEPGENWQEKIRTFMEQPEILILKKTKKNEKEVDIKPYIYEMEIRGESIFLKLAAGSVKNTKPELVMEAFFAFCGQEFQPLSLLIHRVEVYGDLGEESKRRLVSLEDLGEEIE